MRLIVLVIGLLFTTIGFAAGPGVFRDRIVVGGVLDLEGHSSGLGIGMRDGIEAAFKGELVQGRTIEYRTLNDSYTPSLTEQQTKKLVDEGIFAMVGNVGTPTAKVSLPILAKHNIPAVGFFTGAGLLRPGPGKVFNYRASYVQETERVISQTLAAGVHPTQICAFVQNDAYGMAGVEGIKQAMLNRPQTRVIVEKLDQILAQQGTNPDRNNIGPVGVYERNTLTSRNGYLSLKAWEKSQETQCRLVVTVGTYNAVGRFTSYSRRKGDNWLVSAVSFTGAENLRDLLAQYGVESRLIVTQVVPELDANLPIVKQAKRALGDRLNVISLEGYIVGKMFLEMLREVKGEITQEKFAQVVENSQYSIGGLNLDFRGDNQGSDLVKLTYLENKEFKLLESAQLSGLL